VGGIKTNATHPADFLSQNLAIATNVIHAAYAAGVKKLLNFGSSCIYPRNARQPIGEDALLTGPLESTNEAYALAKIAALKLCAAYHKQYGANFFSVMPTNLYGRGDNYDFETSHVLPALIAHFHTAKVTGATTVTLWGDGSPLREFLYADDLAKAAIHLMQHHDAADIGSHINAGSGVELTIAELANTVRSLVYADAMDALPTICWDTTQPNGTARKLLDSTRINALGWQATTPLKAGIKAAYDDYLSRYV
jgi:GDP-L-fucose synthase